MKRRMYLLASAAALTVLLVLAGFVTITMASPPSGVTPTLLARGTYEPFSLSSDPATPSTPAADLPWWWSQWGNIAAQYRRSSSPPGLSFEAKAKAPLDVVVRRHDYAVGSTTGWHSHPGPVFITVTQGTLTYYEYDDPACTPHVVSAGQGFVDNGRGHIVRNESGAPAQDMSVIIAPVRSAFRGELDAPGPYCTF